MTERGQQVRNVLVVGPSVGSVADELCGRLLWDVHQVDSIVGVTIVQSPRERLRRWNAVGDVQVEPSFVDVERKTRAATEHETPSTLTPMAVDRVEDPTDLAAIGRAVADQLETADGEPGLCFHSLSDVLEYVELQRALEFCHTLVDHVEAADARAHFHLDAGSHDSETIELFATVTDRVVEASYDGSDVTVE